MKTNRAILCCTYIVEVNYKKYYIMSFIFAKCLWRANTSLFAKRALKVCTVAQKRARKRNPSFLPPLPVCWQTHFLASSSSLPKVVPFLRPRRPQVAHTNKCPFHDKFPWECLLSPPSTESREGADVLAALSMMTSTKSCPTTLRLHDLC